MRIRFIVGLLTFAIVCSAQAQWTPVPPANTDYTLAGRAGIGGATHSTARLRLTEGQGVLTNGPFHLAFGSTTSMWWAFRLDTGNHLHLDRDSDTGWAEGFVFKRDGNFGIGVDPTQLFHASRDGNGPTLMRLNNGSNGTLASRGLQFTEGSTVKAEIRSLSSGYDPSARANALELWNYGNGPIIFGSNNVERMRIFADGNVSIGGATNLARLGIMSNTDNARAITVSHRAMVESNAAQNEIGLLVQVMEDLPAGVVNTGSVTGGQMEGFNMGPSGTMHYATGGVFRAGNYTGTSGTILTAYGLQSHVIDGSGTVGTGYGLYISDIEATNDYGVYQINSSDTNFFGGNVIIGGTAPTTAPPATYALNVHGDANFNGTVTGTNIKAHYQDVAEWVPSTTDLAPGTVVILNQGRNNEVMASATAYDTTVAGVVSAQPGLILGVEGTGKEQVATTGRVKVRVDARRQSVKVGDLLVTSDMPGTAMRSEPMSINGRAFHQPGTIIGKALEPLDGGVGEILVLLSMQ
ncbi:MAG TPA: hypothetical protein VEX88_14935 [Glaciibacter sp.]|nr:hypothetical protein [Glaciibacter sp.]